MSGLDPVGTDVMREVMLDLRRRGATIVLSSHQMDTVEKLCDRVILINRGEKTQSLLYPIIVPLVVGIMLFPMILESPDSPQAVLLSLVPFLTPLLMFLRIVVLRVRKRITFTVCRSRVSIAWWERVLQPRAR